MHLVALLSTLALLSINAPAASAITLGPTGQLVAKRVFVPIPNTLQERDQGAHKHNHSHKRQDISDVCGVSPVDCGDGTCCAAGYTCRPTSCECNTLSTCASVRACVDPGYLPCANRDICCGPGFACDLNAAGQGICVDRANSITQPGGRETTADASATVTNTINTIVGVTVTGGAGATGTNAANGGNGGNGGTASPTGNSSGGGGSNPLRGGASIRSGVQGGVLVALGLVGAFLA